MSLQNPGERIGIRWPITKVIGCGLFVSLLPTPGCANWRSGLKDDRNAVSYNRDLSDCEREAAAVGAGGKARAFDNCMKAKGHTPKP